MILLFLAVSFFFSAFECVSFFAMLFFATGTVYIPLASALADRGYRVFLVEYRLSTEALYPAAMQDAQAALQWVSKRKNVGEIYVAGYSAGGQMAALLGSVQDENTYGKGVKVAAVIDIDGILAFIHPESGEGDDSKKTSAATYYFGYNKVDGEAIWKEGSALSHVSEGDPPVLFLNSGVERVLLFLISAPAALWISMFMRERAAVALSISWP